MSVRRGEKMTADVCIIGGGPAGLSAALILGRCRRRVVLFDAGEPRNAASRALHGFLTRDGVGPRQLRDLGRAELERYPSVTCRAEVVVGIGRTEDGGFLVRPRAGPETRARIVLLATGRVDPVPPTPGFSEFYGRGVYHCPVCDGWEHRDQPLAVHGHGRFAAELALELRTWSTDVALCTDGPAHLDTDWRARLVGHGVAVLEHPIRRLRGDERRELAAIEFWDGATRPCRALFFDTAAPQRSPLAEWLGCEVEPSGAIRCNNHAATKVPGVFVAGNVRCGVHLAITAAAEGAEAAIAINDALIDLEWGEPAKISRP